MKNERPAASDVFSASERASRFPVEDVAHRQALRLTISFDGPRMQLMLTEAIAMTLPPSMPLTDEPPGAAFWFELHDDAGTQLYRRRQRHPLDPTVEIRTGNPERPLAHRDSGRTAGTFTLLVPQLSEAHFVVLYGWSAPPDDEKPDGEPTPTELTRFAIGKAVDDDVIAGDTIPPTTVSDAVAAYRSVAVIRLRAFDNLGDVAQTLYRVDDGRKQEGLTVAVKKAGRHRVSFWSVDRAGNVEAENEVTFTVGRSVEG